MTAPVKNKGGRPSNAELALRGITKTELEIGLKILKKVFGPSIDKMIELSDDASLSVKDRFKMKQDLVNMYKDFLRTDQALKQAIARGDGDEAPQADEGDKPKGVVFDLFGSNS